MVCPSNRTFYQHNVCDQDSTYFLTVYQFMLLNRRLIYFIYFPITWQ